MDSLPLLGHKWSQTDSQFVTLWLGESEGLAGFSAQGASRTADVDCFAPIWEPPGEEHTSTPIHFVRWIQFLDRIFLLTVGWGCSKRLKAACVLYQMGPPSSEPAVGNLPRVRPTGNQPFRNSLDLFKGLIWSGQAPVDNLLFDELKDNWLVTQFQEWCPTVEHEGRGLYVADAPG